MNTKHARKNRKKHPRSSSRDKRRKSPPVVVVPFAEKSLENRPLNPGSTGGSLEELPSKVRTTTQSGDLTGILGDKSSDGETVAELIEEGRELEGARRTF